MYKHVAVKNIHKELVLIVDKLSVLSAAVSGINNSEYNADNIDLAYASALRATLQWEEYVRSIKPELMEHIGDGK